MRWAWTRSPSVLENRLKPDMRFTRSTVHLMEVERRRRGLDDNLARTSGRIVDVIDLQGFTRVAV